MTSETLLNLLYNYAGVVWLLVSIFMSPFITTQFRYKYTTHMLCIPEEMFGIWIVRFVKGLWLISGLFWTWCHLHLVLKWDYISATIVIGTTIFLFSFLLSYIYLLQTKDTKEDKEKEERSRIQAFWKLVLVPLYFLESVVRF